MKPGWNHILFSISILALAAGIFTVYGLQKMESDAGTCTKMEISFTDSDHLMTSRDVKECIYRNYGALTGRRTDSLDLMKIEDAIDRECSVLKSQVWKTDDGLLHICITERKPLGRLQMGTEGYYFDRNGVIFPLCPSRNVRIPVIDGNIPIGIDGNFKGEPAERREREWIAEMAEMLEYMRDSTLWYGNIAQINVQNNGELVMIPGTGDEKFVFGDCSGYRDKFKRIDRYYTHIVQSCDTVSYRTVTVKYKGQTICEK